MKQFMKKLMLAMLCAAVVLTTSSMGTLHVSAASVKLNKTKATVSVKGSIALKVKGTSKKVTWSSSTKSVATVSSSGVVTGRKKGSATITAKIGKKKLRCKVTVKDNTSKLYKKFLEANTRSYDVYYVLDIDRNGVPDLIAAKASSPLMHYNIFTVKGKKVINAGNFGAKDGFAVTPTIYYSKKYHALRATGWTNIVGGSWSNLYTLSKYKVKHIAHSYEETYPSKRFFSGKTSSDRKQVSKSAFLKHYKKYFSNIKAYDMLSNTAANRTKSFG